MGCTYSWVATLVLAFEALAWIDTATNIAEGIDIDIDIDTDVDIDIDIDIDIEIAIDVTSSIHISVWYLRVIRYECIHLYHVMV